MKENCEKKIKIGFKKKPAAIFNEVERVSAQMIRNGWVLKDTCIEDGLGYIHLFFERQLLINNLNHTQELRNEI